MLSIINTLSRQRIRSFRRKLVQFRRSLQHRLFISFSLDRKSKRLIIFFIEGPWQTGGQEIISGGLTSIENIYQLSRKLKDIHGAEVVLCTISGSKIFKFSSFKSDSRIIHVDQLAAFDNVSELLIHIPEYCCKLLLEKLEEGSLLKKNLGSNKRQLNVLNQNIEVMPSPLLIEELGRFFDTVTQTTAHRNYTSDLFLAKYGIPYHFLSVRLDRSQYCFREYDQKKKVILFSPDDHEKNEIVKKILEVAAPTFTLMTIQNLKYDDYKKLMSEAMFCFSFGEGLDGYFVEGFFSGTICFTLYNDRFFSPEYESLPSIFADFQGLCNNIAEVISKLTTPAAFNSVLNQTLPQLELDYNYGSYEKNVRDFYATYFSGD